VKSWRCLRLVTSFQVVERGEKSVARRGSIRSEEGKVEKDYSLPSLLPGGEDKAPVRGEFVKNESSRIPLM